jgi:pimeloyl-ACP methyl ester carboxylesterase
MSRRRKRLALSTLLLALTLPACGSDESESTGDDAAAEPTEIDKTFDVGEDPHGLAIKCEGEGSPTVVFEAGYANSGTIYFKDQDALPQIVEETRACLYDRAGEGFSDPIPKKRRTIDDLSTDLSELLEAADVEPPYVMVGHSFGGFVATQFTATRPDEVAGLVLLDVPPPDPKERAKDPAIRWNSPENLTRIDPVEAETTVKAIDSVGDIPVRVVSGKESDLSPEQYEYWLGLSPQAEQVVVEGGHDNYLDDPSAVVDVILEVVASADAEG